MLQKLVFGNFNDSQVNHDAFRYSFITNAIALVHLLFAISFLFMQVYPMSVYNGIIVIMYFIIARSLSDLHNYDKIYFVYLVEILLHSCLATLLVGWDFGFMLYLIGLIPVSFYMTFSISSFKRKLFYPFLTSGCVFSLFFALRIVTYFIEPVYQDINVAFNMFFYILNHLIAFVTTFFFSALFAIEVNSMQLKMESEQEKLEDQASYDPLTHFLNRRSMDERLNNAHRNALINSVPYSLIMCDIDHFKLFNDEHGHDCGDFVLQNISKIISNQIRAKDSACRWGGEEFLILINDNIDIAQEVAERIRIAIEKNEFYYDGKTLHVTITMGVVSYFTSSKVKTLIEIADKRLYKGKENGRNQVISS